MTDDISRATSQSPAQAPAGQEAETARGASLYRPLADIRESGDGVVLTVEMPGVGPDDVDIEIERRVLTIRGRGRLTRPEGFRRVYTEYGEGDYERAFTLSEEVDESQIRASMHAGVLTLELPRAEAARPKRIKVQAG